MNKNKYLFLIINLLILIKISNATSIFNQNFFIEKGKLYQFHKFNTPINLNYEIKSKLDWQFNVFIIDDKNYNIVKNNISLLFNSNLYLKSCSVLYQPHAIKSCFIPFDNSYILLIGKYTNNNLSISIDFTEVETKHKTIIEHNLFLTLIITSSICVFCCFIIGIIIGFALIAYKKLNKKIIMNKKSGLQSIYDDYINYKNNLTDNSDYKINNDYSYYIFKYIDCLCCCICNLLLYKKLSKWDTLYYNDYDDYDNIENFNPPYIPSDSISGNDLFIDSQFRNRNNIKKLYFEKDKDKNHNNEKPFVPSTQILETIDNINFNDENF